VIRQFGHGQSTNHSSINLLGYGRISTQLGGHRLHLGDKLLNSMRCLNVFCGLFEFGCLLDVATKLGQQFDNRSVKTVDLRPNIFEALTSLLSVYPVPPQYLVSL